MSQPHPHASQHPPLLRLIGPRDEPAPARSHTGAFSHVLATTRAGRAYLAELDAIPTLTRSEEWDIALRIEGGERMMLEALLRIDDVRAQVRDLIRGAAAGELEVEVFDEAPGNDVAAARLRRLVDALGQASADEEIALLSNLRLERQHLERLVRVAEASNPGGGWTRAVAQGRREAESGKREIVRRHLWLAVSIAARYPAERVELMDRIQEGNIGLMRAADRFRLRKGFRFATYATWWVRQAIHRAVAEQGYCVRLPSKTVEAAQRAERFRRRFSVKNGRDASDHEVADALSVSVYRLHEIDRGVDKPVFVDADNEPELVCPDNDAEAAVANAQRRVVLCEQLAGLEAREQQVIAMRFGLDDDEEKTRDEIASVFSLTRERIRQVEKHAMDRLQHPSRVSLLRAV